MYKLFFITNMEESVSSHNIYNSAKDAGFTEKQAEFFVQNSVNNYHNLATKNDLKLVDLALRSDIKNLETDLRSDIKSLETDLRSDIKNLETDLRSDIKNLETELRSDIKTNYLTLDNKIDKSVIKTVSYLTVIFSFITVVEKLF